MLAITAKLVRNRLRDLSIQFAELSQQRDHVIRFNRFDGLKRSLHDQLEIVTHFPGLDSSLVVAWNKAKQDAKEHWPNVYDQSMLSTQCMVGYFDFDKSFDFKQGRIVDASLGAAVRSLYDTDQVWGNYDLFGVYSGVCNLLADLEFGTGNNEQGDALGELPGEKVTYTPAADPEEQHQKNLDWLKTLTDAQRLALFQMVFEGKKPGDVDSANVKAKAKYKGKAKEPCFWENKNAYQVLASAKDKGVILRPDKEKHAWEFTHPDYLNAVRPES